MALSRHSFEGVKAEVALISDKDQDQNKNWICFTVSGRRGPWPWAYGVNDALMLKHAGIGIAVLGEEGMAMAALKSADLMVRNILDVFSFFEDSKRLIAT